MAPRKASSVCVWTSSRAIRRPHRWCWSGRPARPDAGETPALHSFVRRLFVIVVRTGVYWVEFIYGFARKRWLGRGGVNLGRLVAAGFRAAETNFYAASAAATIAWGSSFP